MTVTLELKPEVEAAARAEAQARGLAVEDYLLRFLESALPRVPTPAEQMPMEEWLRLLRSIGVPAGVSLSDEAVSRESLYEDHL